MKTILRNTLIATLALLFCSTPVLADSLLLGTAGSGAATTPQPEIMFLFGMGLLGLVGISRRKFKN